MILIVILVFLLIFSMLTGKAQLDKLLGYLGLFFALVALLWAVSADYLGYGGFDNIWYNLDSTTISWIAFIAGIVIVIAISGGLSTGDTKFSLKNVGDSFNELFKGKDR